MRRNALSSDGEVFVKYLFFLCALVCIPVLCACAGPQGVARQGAQVPLADEWFEGRAEGLSVSVEDARKRDALLGDPASPPESSPEMLEVGAVLWRDLCATCHGVDGKAPPVEEGAAQPRSWGGGSRMGFFFGGDKMRGGLFKTIRDGKGTGMPAWGETLSNEQIWALVGHLEGF